MHGLHSLLTGHTKTKNLNGFNMKSRGRGTAALRDLSCGNFLTLPHSLNFTDKRVNSVQLSHCSIFFDKLVKCR